MAVVSLFAGTIVDRTPKLKVLIISDVTCMFLTLIASPFAATQYTSMALIGLNAMLTVFSLTYYPALNASIPLMSDEKQRISFNSHLYFAIGSGRFVAPLLGGWIVAYLRTPYILIIDSISFAASAIAAFIAFRGMNIRETPPGKKAPQKKSVLISSIEGLSYLRSDRPLLLFVLAFPFIEAVEAVFPLGVPLALRQYHLSSHIYGVIMSCLAFSLILGTILSRVKALAVSYRKYLSVNFLIQSLGMLVIASGWPRVYMAVIGVCVLGFTSGIAQVHFASLIQTKVKREFLGRMFATVNSLATVLVPLAPLMLIPFRQAQMGDLFYALFGIMFGCGLLVFIGIRNITVRG